jgi:hypothetical protein
VTPVFADASYYVALLSPRDQHHQDALRVSGTLRRPIVVSEFVLIELTNALASVESRGRAVALWPHLRNDPLVTIVPASTELVAQALDLYARRPDKEWSLTDCTSFVVMEQLGLTDALTADHHFRQAGFSALLIA